MWIRVIQWISIGLCWGSLGLNIWSAWRSNKMFKQYREKYFELLNKERGNE